MHDNDPYVSWKQRRARSQVPEDFAGHVMTRLKAYEAQRRLFRGWQLGVLSSRAGKIAICALACLACALRMLSVFAIFLADKRG